MTIESDLLNEIDFSGINNTFSAVKCRIFFL